MDEDILFLKSLLREEPCPNPLIIPNQTKSPIEEPKHSFNMGYEHFNTNLVTNDVAESSTKNLVPIPHESKVTSDDGSESIEPVKDDFLVFTTILNPLFNNDKINSDEINSHVESNSDEFTSNHDTVKFDNLDEFSRPVIPIHIVEEERIRREHADYINRMEMLFTINPRPHPSTYANTNVESFSSLPIPIQESDPHQDETDVVTSTNDVLPPSIENDDSDGESEDSDFDNTSVPLPPPEPPDEEFDFEIDFGNEISVVRNTIVKFECIDARVKFDVFNDENDNSYFIFVIFDKKVEQINKIDFIDAGGRYFDSEEIENFLNDDSIPLAVEDSPFNMDEDILFLKSLIREEPCPNPPIIPNQTKSPIEEPKHSFNMGYEHFNTNLVINDVTESSTKNLVPIPHESKVTSDDGSESIEPVKDDFLVFTTISNPLFNNDKINSDEINSHVESNYDEFTSNHDTVKFDNLDEFSGPVIPIHIVEEERIRREHADYINRMEMLFTINPRPHPSTYANTNVESFSSLPIPIQESDPHQDEIDVVTSTNDVLPQSIENDDSDVEVDAVDVLRVDNSISNSEHEFFESEDSEFDNPSVPLPPPEPPDEEFDFEIDFGNEILVVWNTIVKFECIDARVKFDVFNDEKDNSYFIFFIFDKVFS
nr:hypothetical protein [Tanacetum cinerariifolium]